MITKGDLQNRDAGKGRRDEPVNGSDAAERLAQLEQRIAQARTLKPSGPNLHCEDCFTRGREAVLKLLAG